MPYFSRHFSLFFSHFYILRIYLSIYLPIYPSFFHFILHSFFHGVLSHFPLSMIFLESVCLSVCLSLSIYHTHSLLRIHPPRFTLWYHLHHYPSSSSCWQRISSFANGYMKQYIRPHLSWFRNSYWSSLNLLLSSHSLENSFQTPTTLRGRRQAGKFRCVPVTQYIVPLFRLPPMAMFLTIHDNLYITEIWKNIGIMIRMFAYGPEDRGSIQGKE